MARETDWDIAYWCSEFCKSPDRGLVLTEIERCVNVESLDSEYSQVVLGTGHGTFFG